MKVIIRKDSTAMYGKYDIFIDRERGEEPVAAGHGTWMYYSGHPYHSQNDISYNFHVELQAAPGTAEPADADALYLVKYQSEQGRESKSEIDVQLSRDGGRTWVAVKEQDVPAGLVVLQTVHPK